MVKKSSIDILSDSLINMSENSQILKEAKVTSAEIKQIISILKDEQFSEDNRKSSKLALDKILDKIVDEYFSGVD